MRSKLCFLITWFCMWQVKLTFMQSNNLYASDLNILEDDIRTYFALLLLSRYCKVPYRSLYWADAPDTHNETVSCAMSRNRFLEVLSNLHLTDNTQITEEDSINYEYYLKSWVSISNIMVHLSIKALMKTLFLSYLVS